MGTAATRLWHLERLDLLRGLGPAGLDALAQRTLDREVGRGSLIGVRDGPSSVYLVKRGTVRLFRVTTSGREVTTALLGPGRLFGTASFVPGAEPELLARAVDDVLLCQTRPHELLALARDHPGLMVAMIRDLVWQLLRAEQAIERLASGGVAARVAATLLSAQEGPTPSDRTNEEWAALCGTTRESVSRTFSRFRRAGWIVTRGHAVAIRDAAALRMVADGGIALPAPGGSGADGGGKREPSPPA
ncbi:MAG TPA: Crp/Fnr family transcriptional regulator [Candidatus Saccharimonadales bacterium]|nr:Crp/Fnr family transcriptional regulator [Candidatus Saccharimonadales bacterium]